MLKGSSDDDDDDGCHHNARYDVVTIMEREDV